LENFSSAHPRIAVSGPSWLPPPLRSRWWVVAACGLALVVGSGVINVYAFGVFMKPMSEELGVGRSVLSSGILLGQVMSAIAYALVGVVTDRYGPRGVMMLGIPLFAAATACYALLTPSLAMIYLVFAFVGLVGVVQSPVTFGAILAKWFDDRRGLALGFATAGVGVGTAIVPLFANVLLERLGWRNAFLGVALLILVVAWLPMLVFIREPSARDVAETPDVPEAAKTGMSAREAFASWRFWALTAAFFLGVPAITGTLTHTVALFTDRGIPASTAIQVLTGAGLALIAGRVVSGWLLDRFFGPTVAVVFFVLPMAGITLLLSGLAGVAPYLGVILVAITAGGEIDVMAFLATRFFGLKAYGKIYGVMFAFFAIGTGLGPYLAGLSFDWFHSYTPSFLLFEGGLVITCVLFMTLGPYTFPKARTPRAVPITARLAE